MVVVTQRAPKKRNKDVSLLLQLQICASEHIMQKQNQMKPRNPTNVVFIVKATRMLLALRDYENGGPTE